MFSVSLASASTTTFDNNTNNNTETIENIKSYSYSNVSVQPQDDSNYIINERNYKIYFDDENTLKKEYNSGTIIFNGEFSNIGKITINTPNIKITGRNTIFHNTVFHIKSNNITLSNIKFILNESFKNNNNAGIYITGDNIIINNINLTYNTPIDSEAICIYSNNNNNLSLINNSINFTGHAYHNGRNYAILLLYSDDAYICDNNIISTLPLRAVDWSEGIYGGVGMDKVFSFAAGNSKNLTLSKNNIYSCVNYGEYANSKYPTLSSVLIYACDNSIIYKNNIKFEDKYTKKNQSNYLYALDIYRSNDIVIVENNVDVFTYGGYDRYGTAYPIQVTGPAYNIKIAYNNLQSISNGPNIGIYSQNFYGSTQIDIISNYINITGKASTDIWSLVAGIEVQDSNDNILNNTIIVNTVGGYKSGDKIYGISYSQNTNGDHSYNIKYNNVTVPGPIAINLNQGLTSTTSDTNVMYNILSTAIGEGGDKAVTIGGNGVNNIIRYNTNGQDTVRHMSVHDMPQWLKNYNAGEGNGYFWLNTDGGHSGNSLLGGEGQGSGLSNGEGEGSGFYSESKRNGVNIKFSSSDAQHGDDNSTRYDYGISGVNIASASSSAGSSSSSQSNIKPKAYEVTKQIPKISDINYLQSIVIILFVLGLLVFGYVRKEHLE